MTHRLAILFALVRQHVENQQPPAGFQRSRRFAERSLRLRHVMQDKKEKCDVQFSRINGKLFQRSLTEFNVTVPGQSSPSPRAASLSRSPPR